MADFVLSYQPIKFQGEPGISNRITKEQFTRKIELEGAIGFLKAQVINQFEEALKESPLEKLVCGDFTLTISDPKPTSRTSWKSVYEGLAAFLEIRADDSRAATHKDVKFIEGIGYCVSVEALSDHIHKLVEEATTTSKNRSLGWPSSKRKGEVLPTKIRIPNKDYSEITGENGIVVLQTKRFNSGIQDDYLETFKEELQRWFEANTGYHKDRKIPEEEIRSISRALEITEGSYMNIQLIREEDPQYKNVIETIQTKLEQISKGNTVQEFKNRTDGTSYVNIKQVYDFLSRDILKKNDFIKVHARWEIVP